MRRFERADAAPARPAEHAHLPVPRRLRRPTTSSSTARRPASLDLRRRQRARRSSPRATLVAEVGGADRPLALRRRRPVPGRIVMRARGARFFGALLRVVVAGRRRGRRDRAVAAAARHPARLGDRALRRRRSAGRLARAARARASPTGTGAPTASSLHTLAIGIPATMAVGGHARPAGAAGFARDRASAPVSSSRPARSARCSAGSRCSGATASCVRLARREGFGPFLSAAGAGRALRGARSGVRLRRVLEEAGGVYVKLGQIAATRVDLVPPEVVRRAVDAAEPGRAGAGREHPARARGRARRGPSTRCSPSSTGSRSPPRRSGRRTGRGCAPVSRSS